MRICFKQKNKQNKKNLYLRCCATILFMNADELEKFDNVITT